MQFTKYTKLDSKEEMIQTINPLLISMTQTQKSKTPKT